MRKQFITFALVCIAFGLHAQIKLPNGAEISLGGDFRTLTEIRQGYKNILPETAEPAFVISQRSRLILDYNSKAFDLRFSFQDARAWGETFVINSTKPLLMHEAWIKYHFNPTLGLKIGRQSIEYGDNRMFSTRNWSMQGAAHDAAIIEYQHNGTKIDFGLAANNSSTAILEATPYLIKNYKSMSWIWISKKFNPKFELNLLNVLAGYQKAGTITTYGLNTTGVNPVVNLGGFNFNGSAYYQFGKNSLGNTHQAHLYTANLKYEYQFFSLGVGYDHYSGKKYSETNLTDKYFITIVESVAHGFLGFMDIATGTQFQSQHGISDLNIKLKYGKATSFAMYFHALAYAQQPAENKSNQIGKEFDFLLSHKFNKNLSLELGYSFLLTHEDYKDAVLGPSVNERFPQWAYLLLAFKPNLLQ
ncbi:MAG TPA: hypothetical protein DCG69_02655 [Bacteroidales bacterium]|nr:hypothetical protein [Bacteroidales bacterium]